MKPYFASIASVFPRLNVQYLPCRRGWLILFDDHPKVKCSELGGNEKKQREQTIENNDNLQTYY